MPDEKEKPEGEKPWWAEAVKDLTSAGLATYFMTEESVRNYLRERKLPKEAVGLFLDGMNRRKDDLYKVVGNEIGAFLSKLTDSHSVKVEAKISFEPKKGAKKESK
ncbi:hypothetical protein K2X33_14945 [bacterium]|nr:hypothetical protein [bacterium]